MTSYLIITGYFIIACILFASSVQKNNRKNVRVLLFFIFGVMIVLFGFRRYDVGNDTIAYYRFFTHISSGEFDYDSRLEYGFRLITIAIASFTDNYLVYQIILAAITLIPEAILIYKTSDDCALSVLLFWLLCCVPIVSAARQGISISIAILAFFILRRQKKGSLIIYCALCIIASTVHLTGIVFLILPFVTKIQIKKKTAIFLIIVSIFATMTNLNDYIFELVGIQYYMRYLDAEAGSISILYYFIITIISLSIGGANSLISQRDGIALSEYTRTGTGREVEMNEYINLENANIQKFDESFFKWSSVIFGICYMMTLRSSITSRVALSLTPYFVCYTVHNLSQKNVRYAILAKILFIIILLSYNIFALIYRPRWNSFFPYHFIWQENP